VKETIEPGLSTVPGAGFCVSTVSGGLTGLIVVVVTAGAVVEVGDEIVVVVVVVVDVVVVVVGRPTE
jgi:hypothetical protein